MGLQDLFGGTNNEDTMQETDSRDRTKNSGNINMATQLHRSQHGVTTVSSAGNQSMSKVMRIKVQIEDKLLLVPVVDR